VVRDHGRTKGFCHFFARTPVLGALNRHSEVAMWWLRKPKTHGKEIQVLWAVPAEPILL
jgi:hypothetical protein